MSQKVTATLIKFISKDGVRNQVIINDKFLHVFEAFADAEGLMITETRPVSNDGGGFDED